MVPLSVCSLINLSSSSISGWDRWMFWLIRVGGAPGFSSILWSHGCDGGSFFDSWSLNTFLNFWYGSGTFSRFLFVDLMCIQGCFVVLGWKQALSALFAFRTMGSCE